MNPNDRAHTRHSLERLTVFVFLWAAQALVHQEFFQIWHEDGMWSGWLLTGLAFAVLLRPTAIALFAAMLATSVVYNVARWPMVANHILVESLLNVTMLAALAWTLFARRDRSAPTAAQDAAGWEQLGLRSREDREAFFQLFAPVLRGMMITMYFFAFFAKLNTGFLDPSVSCTTAMWGDLLDRFPFLPDAHWAHLTAIWGTIVVEAAIPALFCFRRTRPLAIAIGLPFHLMLGLIGHRTFSGIVFPLYFLFASEEFCATLERARGWLVDRYGESGLNRGIAALRVTATVVVGTMILLATLGHRKTEIGLLEVDRIAVGLWLCWSLLLMAVYFTSLARSVVFDDRAPAAVPLPSARPRLLYVMVALVVLNGMTQYLGLKTKTSFTMYSNLRTEGGEWNHLLMPRGVQLATFQDDLVEILETNDPRLAEYIESGDLITHFELKRMASRAESGFEVRYRYQGGEHLFRAGEEGSAPELAEPPSILLAKLLYFRPVTRDGQQQCKH